MSGRLEGKKAIITGAGSGIGRGIAVQFSREGAALAVADLNLEAAEKTATLVRQEGGEAFPFAVDVAEETSVERMVQEAVNALGGLDILVNCAGISKIIPFLQTSVELWDRIMAVNLRGTFLCCREALRIMEKQKSGVIINLSSQSGKQGNSWFAAYCASKFGVIGLTQSIALDFAPVGIRINALCPGVVWTEMWEQQAADYAAKRGLRREEVKSYLEGRIPLARTATVEEVAQVAVFLASEESSYMTGQAINITGGQLMS